MVRTEGTGDGKNICISDGKNICTGDGKISVVVMEKVLLMVKISV